MGTSRKKAFRDHGRRRKKQGLKRVEVEVTESDAALIRRLAKVLRCGGEIADEARHRLTKMIAATSLDLKDLLASAPMDGIRITRYRDPGRSIDL